MTVKHTLVKVANPEQGLSHEEYEAICKALGMEPKYEARTEPGAASSPSTESGVQDSDHQT